MSEKRLDFGLPFRVSAVQAVQFYEAQRLTPLAISKRLSDLGAGPERIRQALCRARKLKRAERTGRTGNVGKQRTV